MDRLDKYRDVIKKILTEYHSWASNSNIRKSESCLVFDEVHDQYFWFLMGWQDKRKYRNILRYQKNDEQESLSSCNEISDQKEQPNANIEIGTKIVLPSTKSFRRISKQSRLGTPLIQNLADNTNYRKSNFYLDPSPRKGDPAKKKTFYDVITNFYLTKKFVSILQRLTVIRKPKFLNESHFNLIGDKTFYYQAYQDQMERKIINEENGMRRCIRLKNLMVTAKNDLKLKIKKRFLLKLNVQVFQPFSIYNLVMDFINMFIYILFFILIPINLCFRINIFEEMFEEKTIWGENNYNELYNVKRIKRTYGI